MQFLLDANVLIDANRDYYRLGRVPEFWYWLQHQGAEGRVKVPLETYEEVKDGTDSLATWIKQPDVKAALLIDAEADPALVGRAVSEGYAPDLPDDEIEKLGRDPFLIAYVLPAPTDYCIVTTEVYKPSK